MSFNYGSAHICENTSKLGKITLQSKVEDKMTPYRTAVTIITAILGGQKKGKGSFEG